MECCLSEPRDMVHPGPDSSDDCASQAPTEPPKARTNPVLSSKRYAMKLFSETCDERALPLVGSRSESAWKGGSRGGVAGGWNAAYQSLVTWYIPGQTVQTAASQALTEPLKASTYSQPLRLDAA